MFILHHYRLKKMQNAFLRSDGFHIDNADNMIVSTYVDLRNSADRQPITTLIKRSSIKYAIERRKEIRISKPTVFQNTGESLINDPSETRTSKTITTKRDTTTEHLAEMQPVYDELARSSGRLYAPIRFTTRSAAQTNTTTESVSSGKNGWLFCASIEPAEGSEKDNWRLSMPKSYDHVSHIRSPREFARALGVMVAAQLGPQGKDATLKHGFGDCKFTTEHKCQQIYHGPVVYAENPYDMIFDSPTSVEFALLPLFIKSTKYKDQREYRFLVFTEEEPSANVVNLDVSLAMLESMQGHYGTPQRMSQINQQTKSLQQQKTETERSDKPAEEAYGHELSARLQSEHSNNSDIRKLIDDPSTPVTPHVSGNENVPSHLHAVVTTYSVLRTLRDVLAGPFGTRRVTGEHYVDASSAAWHAVPCIQRLCSIFKDPIKNIAIEDEDLVAITIKFPAASPWKGKILVGPQGTVSWIVKTDKTLTVSPSLYAWPVGDHIADTLKKTDIEIY